MRRMGPVLFFRGVRDGAWALAALVTHPHGEEPEPLSSDTDLVAPTRLAERSGQVLWRYDFTLALDAAPKRARYGIGEQSWPVHLPGEQSSLRIAFTACNGSEQGDAWGESRQRNRLWLDLHRKHARSPFNLLIQGGDQLYADPIWREVPGLSEWRRQPWRKRREARFTPEMQAAVRDYYFKQYCWVWGQAELAHVLAQVPSLMMWDDHDIVDGWGSYPAKWRDCEVLQGIWGAARESFALFQLAAPSDDLPEGFSDRRGGHFGWAYRLGDVGIVAPDLRSARTRSRVLGEAGRRALMAALEGMSGCRQVLLLCTVPLVNARLPGLERLFRMVPGHQSWQDDLIDQWPSNAHWDEWAGLLRELLSFSARTGAKITSVSGEIHLGALGLIENREAQIHQLTSSGIVHPPPGAAEVKLMEWVSRRPMRVSADIEVTALRMPGSARRYLRSRNWLELELEKSGPLLATWHPEDHPPLRLAL